MSIDRSIFCWKKDFSFFCVCSIRRGGVPWVYFRGEIVATIFGGYIDRVVVVVAPIEIISCENFVGLQFFHFEGVWSHRFIEVVNGFGVLFDALYIPVLLVRGAISFIG